MKTLACTLAALTASLIGGAAGAQTVSAAYGDLNLSRPAGAQTFASRLDAAARQACPVPARGELRTDGQHQECVLLARDSLIRALPTAERAAFVGAVRDGASPYVRAAGAQAMRGASAGG